MKVFPVKPQPALLTIWRIILALLAAIPAFFASLFFSVPSPAWIGVTAAWVVLFLVGYLAYLPLWYHNLSYGLEEGRLVVRRGVFVRRTDVMPLSSIQYVSRRSGPLSRLFGLSTLTAVAAGGRLALPGLHSTEAQNLASALPQSWDGGQQ